MAPANFMWRTFEWRYQDQIYRLEVSSNGRTAQFSSQGPADDNSDNITDVQLLDMPMAAWTALSDAIRQTTVQERRAGLPPRAGKSWSQSECRKVVNAFRDGITIATIAQQQNRTEGAIISRLALLGIIDKNTVQPSTPIAMAPAQTDNGAALHHWRS